MISTWQTRLSTRRSSASGRVLSAACVAARQHWRARMMLVSLSALCCCASTWHPQATGLEVGVGGAASVHRCAVRCGDSCACAAELVLAATLALHQLLKFPLACSAVVVPFEPLLARLVAVTSDAASATSGTSCTRASSAPSRWRSSSSSTARCRGCWANIGAAGAITPDACGRC